jgi:hypothetical protein
MSSGRRSHPRLVISGTTLIIKPLRRVDSSPGTVPSFRSRFDQHPPAPAPCNAGFRRPKMLVFICARRSLTHPIGNDNNTSALDILLTVGITSLLSTKSRHDTDNLY